MRRPSLPLRGDGRGFDPIEEQVRAVVGQLLGLVVQEVAADAGRVDDLDADPSGRQALTPAQRAAVIELLAQTIAKDLRAAEIARVTS